MIKRLTAWVIGMGLMGCSEPSAPEIRELHPRVLMPGHGETLKAALTSTAGQRFLRMVDQQLAGADIYAFAGWHAALAGQLTGKATYCTYAIKLVDDTVRAEETRIAGGERASVAGDSYLLIGEVIGDVMLTQDWCYDQMTAEMRTRWLAYADAAVWNVWHPNEAVWGGKPYPWAGWGTDNPMNNYYYSFLRATMLVGIVGKGELARADEWRTMFRETRMRDEVEPTLRRDAPDGGSREGTGYGVSQKSLFELYDLWQASTTENIADGTSHTKASLPTFLHQVVPTLDRLAPTGDHARDSTAALYDYHRQYLLSLIVRYPDDQYARAAAQLLSESSVPRMSSPFNYVYDLIYDISKVAPTPLTTLPTARHVVGLGQLYARSTWTKDATWVNFTAGPYTENHAHQDQSSVLLYKDEWLIYDPVIDSRSGIPQAVGYHNVVRLTNAGKVLGQKQGEHPTMLAAQRGTGWVHAAADITSAYKSSLAPKVEREVVYLEPNCLVIFDRVQTTAATTQTWQLHLPKAATWSTPRSASMQGAKHRLRVERLWPLEATTSVSEIGGEASDGYRLEAQVAGGTQAWLHVIWIDDDVTSAIADDAEGRRGVRLSFADGGQATVRFSSTAVDGTLTLDRKGVQTTTALGAKRAGL